MTKYNKWDLIDKVLGSTLGEDDKLLLIELVRRCNYEEHKNWECWPSVQRLAQVRGMKNERHFKGVDVYLPGLVDKRKRGRKNVYTLNPAAIMELSQFETVIKHTPALEGVSKGDDSNTPAPAVNTPAPAGANSTVDSTLNSTLTAHSAGSAVVPPTSLIDLNVNDKEEQAVEDSLIVEDSPAAVVPIEGTDKDTPATEGVLNEDDYYDFNGQKILKSGRGDPFGGVATAAPVEPVVKEPCPKCSVLMDSTLCWNEKCF